MDLTPGSGAATISPLVFPDPVSSDFNLIILRTLTMKSLLSMTCLGCAIVLSSLPANAREVTGPRGNSASGTAVTVPNRQGGYTGYRQGTVNGVNGGSANGQIQFRTNGQGSATYSGGGTATRQGQTVNVTTQGSGSHNATSGYSGQNTTTINGTTYTTTTQNRSTTLTTPSGSYTVTPEMRRSRW